VLADAPDLVPWARGLRLFRIIDLTHRQLRPSPIAAHVPGADPEQSRHGDGTEPGAIVGSALRRHLADPRHALAGATREA
jgi:hypothetical protein